MKRVSLYLPESLRARLEVASSQGGWTAGEVIRHALKIELDGLDRPSLVIPLFESRGVPSESARHVDEVLAGGFGRD